MPERSSTSRLSATESRLAKIGGFNVDTVDQAAAELRNLSISFWTMLKQHVNETEAGKRLIRESQWAFNRMTKRGAPKDELLAASAALSELLKAKVIDTPAGNAKFKALVTRIEAAFDKYFPEGAQYTEQVEAKWKEEGQVGNSTLADETPLKQLPPRNKWGLVESNNDVMVGASFGGRQVALREGKTEAGPLATKVATVPERGSVPKGALRNLTGFSRKVEKWFRKAYGTTVRTMNSEQQALADEALRAVLSTAI